MKKEIVDFIRNNSIKIKDDTIAIVVVRDPSQQGISIVSMREFNNRSEARAFIYDQNLSDPLNEYTMREDIDDLIVLSSRPNKSDAFVTEYKGATIFDSKIYMRMLEDYIKLLEGRLLS